MMAECIVCCSMFGVVHTSITQAILGASACGCKSVLAWLLVLVVGVKAGWRCRRPHYVFIQAVPSDLLLPLLPQQALEGAAPRLC